MSSKSKRVLKKELDHFPMRWFILILCITSFMLILLGDFFWNSYTEWKGASYKVIRLQKLMGDIRTTDEILTMSARMAASSGNLDWEQRYLKYEPSLDYAIKEAMRILPDPGLREAVSKTDEANSALVAMEMESFELLHNNRQKEAEALLSGKEYERQKLLYQEGIQEALKYMEAYIEKAVADQQNRALISLLSVAIVFLLSLTAWVYILKYTLLYLHQRQKAETDLRRSGEFLDSIIENLPVAVFIKSAEDLRILRVNKAGEELLNLPREQILHKYDRDLYGKKVAEKFLKEDLKVLKSRALLEIPEVRMHLEQREEKILHIRKMPLLDREGKTEYLLCLSVDITETRRVEAELKSIEKERMKAQKLESIGTLAGGIAHDFNNMLQGLFGYLSLAKLKKDDPAECEAMLDQAEGVLRKTVGLTNQLLTFSKGGAPLKSTLSLLPLIEHAAEFALSGSPSDFAVEAETSLKPVVGDANQIRQVLQNIVLNADHSMPGGGTVSIHVRNFPVSEKDLPEDLESGDYVEISITDRGRGISPEILNRIFDPYFSTSPKNSGLGLATAYSIVQKHNGTIQVSSEVGKGSTFRIYLPSLSGHQDPRSPGRTADSVPGKRRILVMDDEEMIRELAKEFIMALGHRVDVSENGDKAVELYTEAMGEKDPYDIVILDLTIRAGKGGRETLKDLYQIDPDVRAVVSSGYSDDSAIASYREQGFKAVLNKPYNFDKLRETLNALLEGF